jgi:Glycosyl hydrolases family 16
VQWDTQMTGCSNGDTRIDTWSYRDDGSETGYAARNVTINNTSLPPPPPASTSCDPTTAPGAISGQGYTMRYSDCFGTLDRSTWCNRQWWESAPAAGTQFVQDGILHLLRRRADGFQNTTISSEPCGQANPRSFRQGYFEARMYWPGVQGAGPAFWLFSTRHATNPAWPNINPVCAQNGEPAAHCVASELDVFEGYGRYPNVFTGTLHRNSSNQYGFSNQTNSNSWQPKGFRLADGWHTYSALWTATEVRWYVDGQLSHTAPVFDSTDQPMHLILSHWNTPWQSDNAVNSSTPDVVDVGVDWVRVWQK